MIELGVSADQQELLDLREALKNFQQTYSPIHDKLSDPKTTPELRGLLINGLASMPDYIQRVQELSDLIKEKENALRDVEQRDCFAPQEDARRAMSPGLGINPPNS